MASLLCYRILHPGFRRESKEWPDVSVKSDVSLSEIIHFSLAGHISRWHFGHSWSLQSSGALSNNVHLLVCVSAWGTVLPGESAAGHSQLQSGSVRVRWDGDVDDKDALVCNAALWWDGGGLHLESHQARSVQSLHGEDDPPAHLVSDAKHPGEHAQVWLLLKYGERRPVLQNAQLGERWQSHHIVMGWNAWGEGEQLILQEQSGASAGTVPVTSTVTRPFNETKVKIPLSKTWKYFMCIFSDSQCQYDIFFLPLWHITADHEKKALKRWYLTASQGFCFFWHFIKPTILNWNDCFTLLWDLFL